METDMERLKKTFDIKIDLIPVKSNNIDRIGYSSEHKLLRVLFKSGVLYQYMDVVPEEYGMLMKSESVGSAFVKIIRNSHKYIKVS